MFKQKISFSLVLVSALMLSGCQQVKQQVKHEVSQTISKEIKRQEASVISEIQKSLDQRLKKELMPQVAESNLSNLVYEQAQIVLVNQDKPAFTPADLTLDKGSWQSYLPLDYLNRVQGADALLGQDLMPTDKREALTINPTGWHNKSIQKDTQKKWLYNRCHLIGFQLTGQNNNPKNLMTGTASLNDPAMLTYENTIAKYIKETNHHVRYRVRPIFKETELLARGIQLQAQSIEDNEISFNVYIFNVQSGYQLDYQTGLSQQKND